MKLTPAERQMVMAKAIPKWLALAARAKDYGIDISKTPMEQWEFLISLEEAPQHSKSYVPSR